MSYQEAIRDSDVLDGLSVRYLKFFGLWRVINCYRTTGRRSAIAKFEVFLTIFLAMPYVFFQYLCYFMIEVDIQKASFLNLHLLACLQICCKVMVFWLRMDSNCRLYSLIRKDFLRQIPECKRGEVRELYEGITKKCNIFCLTAFIVHLSIIVLSVVDPGVSVDYIAHHTGSMTAVTGGKMKILGGWYPLPMAESPYYEAIYVYEAILISWGGTLLAVYNCFFYQLLMCLYAQFTDLGYQISSLKVDYDCDHRHSQESDSMMYKKLYEIIQNHQKLLSYANELRNVYNPLVTMVLGMGIFLLIISVFQFLFGGRGSPMFIFRSFQYAVYQGIEVSMFCFGSSHIETASSDLQYAIYSSDWYKADIKFRKAAQMLMVRARKGVTLTAIRMYPVNVQTIMAFLRPINSDGMTGRRGIVSDLNSLILQFTYTTTALMSRMIEKRQ